MTVDQLVSTGFASFRPISLHELGCNVDVISNDGIVLVAKTEGLVLRLEPEGEEALGLYIRKLVGSSGTAAMRPAASTAMAARPVRNDVLICMMVSLVINRLCRGG